jgi:DNA-directed RNA polymerase specialized sigma24 family protein
MPGRHPDDASGQSDDQFKKVIAYVRTIVRWRLPPTADQENVVGDIILDLTRASAGSLWLPRGDDQWKGLARTIAIRRCYDWFRTPRSSPMPLDEILAPGENGPSPLEGREVLDALHVELDRYAKEHSGDTALITAFVAGFQEDPPPSLRAIGRRLGYRRPQDACDRMRQVLLVVAARLAARGLGP